MQKNIKATNIVLTPAISDYIDKKIDSIEKFIPDSNTIKCFVEVGKSTKHHKSGDVFKAEVNLHIPGNDFYAVAEKDDLYAAIDEVKDEIIREITSTRNKKLTLMRRGALNFKNVLKGITDLPGKFKFRK